jgi:hypothetical protein
LSELYEFEEEPSSTLEFGEGNSMIRLRYKSFLTRFQTSLSVCVALLLIACQDPSDKMLGLQEVADLGTVEVHFSKIIVHRKDVEGTKKILWVFKTHAEGHALHVARSNAIVTLGIDVNRISKDDVHIDDQHISLLLPPIEIIDFDFDPTHYTVDSKLTGVEKTAGWVRPDIEAKEIEEAYRAAEKQVRHQLPYSRLVKMGERRTAVFFRQYLERAGFKDIYITFKKSDLAQFAEGDPE